MHKSFMQVTDAILVYVCICVVFTTPSDMTTSLEMNIDAPVGVPVVICDQLPEV